MYQELLNAVESNGTTVRNQVGILRYLAEQAGETTFGNALSAVVDTLDTAADNIDNILDALSQIEVRDDAEANAAGFVSDTAMMLREISNAPECPESIAKELGDIASDLEAAAPAE